ncbi:MAG TPA: DUF2798 domain-containing protein [Candidatus Scybalousia intestinigallinarum]|nr:DUF2798 domain-containing protein [Candidatus Scybalousia intestinigallinarum]
MPKTKFQDFIYTIIMVILMVYGMVCYNVSLNVGGMQNFVFLEAFKELPIMGTIAFLLEFLIIGKLAQKLAFRLVNPKEDKPIFVVLAISSMIVCLMCPIMSFIGCLLFGQVTIDTFIARWLQTFVLNFPMAFFYQIFYAGPFVRWIFKKIFRNS